VKVVISNCLIYIKPGNMVRKLGKNRENYQQNRGKPKNYMRNFLKNHIGKSRKLRINIRKSRPE